MNIVTLLPFIVLIGAMFLMTRSAKNKQRQAVQMRDQMQPGTGVRTIGGMYATVKEVHEDTVLLEVAPGVHAIYGKNAVGAVLEDAEYNRIVHGIEAASTDELTVPDDASSLTETVDSDPTTSERAQDRDDKGEEDSVDLDKPAADASEPDDDASGGGKDAK